MKRIIFIIIALIVLAAIAGMARFFGQQERLVEYRDEEVSFSFKYPRTWREPAGGGNYQYYEGADILFIKPLSQASNFGIRVVEDKNLQEFDTEETARDLDESLAERFEDFIKVSSEEIKILGVPALDYVFRYAVPADFIGTKQVGVQKEIIFMKGGKLYFLMFYAVPADYKQDLRDFEKVVKSFEITIHDSSNTTQ